MKSFNEINIATRYHADLMVTSVHHNGNVIAAIYDNELFNEGINVFWN